MPYPMLRNPKRMLTFQIGAQPTDCGRLSTLERQTQVDSFRVKEDLATTIRSGASALFSASRGWPRQPHQDAHDD